MANPSLYIACGGSGCKTIQSLTELIAQDPDLRYAFNNRIFYVLIDTEEEQLERTERLIRNQIPNCDHDHIIKIRTSINALSLEKPVHQAFAGKTDKGLERLKNHWWYNDTQEKPFIASGVSPLDRGAGQCPPVSYFLTWSMLDEIGRKLETLFDEIIEDLSGDRTKGGQMSNPFDGLNYHIISGVAGGTGRGCWELLAFKIRQVCEKKFGAAPKPKAVLFDSSITAHVNFNEATRIGTKVNALTAFSQLQCWERMVRAALDTKRLPEGFSYRLPSLRSPDNEQADVLVVEGQAGQKPPVDQTYLIFSRAGSVAVLDKAEDYYLMAGRALYAQLRFFEVGSANINSTYFYNSFGAASYEVPAADVQDYYQSGARVEFLKSLVTETPQVVQSCFAEFRDIFRLNPGLSASNSKGLFPEGKEKDYTLWQKIISGLLEKRHGALESLVTNLADNGSDLESLEEEIKSYITLSEQEAIEAVGQAFADLGEFTTKAEPLLRKLYYRGGDEKSAVKRSVQNLASFCSLANREVFDDQAGCLATMPKSLSGIEIHDPLEIFHKTKSRALGLVGRRFDEGEITQIKDAAAEAIIVNNYDALKSAYIEATKTYLSQFNAIDSNIRIICERVGKLLQDEQQRMADKLGVKDHAQCHNRTFTDANNPADNDALADSRKRFVQRRLKPVRSKEQFEQDCDDPNVVKLRDGNEIDAKCYDRIFDVGLDKQKIEFGEKLKDEVSSSVSISEHFVENTFSLSKTIKELRSAWQLYFNQIAGNRDDYRKVAERFSEFYGFTPERNTHNEVLMPEPDKLVEHMVASLGATTAAYWEVDDQAARKVHVFMPHFDEIDFKEAESDIESAVKRVLPEGTTVDIFPSTKENKANPFAMIALHQDATGQGPEAIRSMQYWSEPGVIEQLKMCEKRGSENAIFHPLDGMNGSTFPDPIYVTNKFFSDTRWKPWVSEDDLKAADRAAVEVVQALIYLFMQPTGRIAEVAANIQWTLPLAELKTTGTLRFNRDGIEWREGKVRINTDVKCKIKNNAEVGRVRAGIAGVRHWLGSPDGQGVLASILQERAQFWEMLADHAGLIKGTAGTKPVHSELCMHMEQVFTELRGKAETNDPEAEEVVWGELINAVRSRDEALV
jgi:hypothetical protein